MNKIFIESELLKELKVTHGFFTRNGGVSSSVYNSLNCKFDVDDSEKNVKQNLNIIAQSLGLSINNLTLLKQVHSNRVVMSNNTINKLEGDAILTNNTKSLLGIVTADCVPILLWDNINKIAGAIHAGWKGAYNGIIENTVNEIVKYEKKSRVYAVIGPSIQQNNYEVDSSFWKLFVKQDLNNKKYFIASNSKDHFLFNLPKYCYDTLLNCGVTGVDDLMLDTYSNSEKFFSCRRAYHNQEKHFGCQISAICRTTG